MTSLPNFLKKRAFLTPNRTAVEMGEQTITFQELYQSSVHLSRKLSFAGVKKGSTVSLFMNNSVELVQLIFALKNIGAIAVLHNTRLTSAELAYQMNDAASILLLVDDVQEWMMELSTPVITRYSLKDLEEKPCTLLDEFCLDDVTTIMYTSGTTGFPKGVKQTHGNHFWSATGSAFNLGLHEDDCWLLAVPIFHISGYSILMRSVLYGMKVRLHKRFDVDFVHQDIMTKGVTIISVVSSMLHVLIEKLGKDQYPSEFRCMLVGGGPVPQSLLMSCKEKEIPVIQTYGMTETCSQIVTLSAEYALKKIGSAGKPLFPSQLKISLHDKEAGAHIIGEIMVKGPNVTPGYFNNKAATASSIREGWLYTGDLGYLDEEGFLYVVDRRSDLIISGGENIYPAEIEAAMLSHPSILEAGVTGVKDEKWGQVPVGVVVTKKDRKLDVEELLDYLSSKLAKFKVPKELIEVDILPRNASNKLVRKELAKLFPKGEDDES
ncbi:2-succinylbenzoate--CoA ligase [Bacillus sp. THAF10]|uniref:o-succinylbenzoate--CoA ligase n=1 Tax=Bacillus sp. THAF10 TaxID=2587848 RepID=UPI001268E583|nr:o-succinylbenzoate--CoA ligase [Bacillus sp. THAF10]QFT90314.1 2-succinylbenzoate--CoA ligase [Bacillus sp. THAF10]